ncbi:suppressor of cytokine signaling 7-like [Paramacrobiotus metropolitanus]|uniref:suppressor of cytokine signaling 7-like n=1 Tax=Paramacrobiotus metropolitanus TaxID=2943436 RepID=UPI002445F270|nr:suppressor of cytokine signaling 7-like [Paramacrobiotus metropolitanus]
MAARSLRKALRKFFGLRKTSSEPRLNQIVDAQPRMNGSHTLLSRGRSVGIGQHNNDIADAYLPSVIPDENLVPEIAEHLQKLNAARSIRLAQESLWYWGPINAAVAETVLENEVDGTFLVRDSTDENFLFSLSCKYDGKVGHVRIEYSKGSFMFRKIHHYKSDNIKDFIENAVDHSRTGKMQFMTRPRPGVDATQILLLYPLSRRRTVQSLQHLCRYTIMQNIKDRDGVVVLPIPLGLKKYLRQPQYFVEFDRNGPPV